MGDVNDLGFGQKTTCEFYMTSIYEIDALRNVDEGIIMVEESKSNKYILLIAVCGTKKF